MGKQEFLNLGKQPLANKFLTQDELDKGNEYFYNLSIAFDDTIKLVSQVSPPDASSMFNENYVYRASASPTMIRHFEDASIEVKKNKGSKLKVLEIGSHEGLFLKHFPIEDAIGIEPCKNFADEVKSNGYKIFNEFWTSDFADQIASQHDKFDVIYSANCICHMRDLIDAFTAVSKVLDKNGVFIFEDPSLAETINRNSYDQLYDEHLHLFSVTALQNLLREAGLKIIRIDNLSVHGGSNRIWAMFDKSVSAERSVQDNLDYENVLGLNEYKTYVDWAAKIKRSRIELLQLLESIKSCGKKIVSYGATSKSTTIFNYCNIGVNLLDYIVDTTPEKIGKFSPGKHLPVVKYTENWSDKIDFGFLGAWNFQDFILNKERDFIKNGGKFITHVPATRII